MEVMKGENEMKSWKKWLVGIGVGVVVIIAGVGFWQRENVQALWEGISYTEEELKGQIETSKERAKEALEQYELEGIRDLTVEEEAKLMKGEISVEEALSLIMNEESQSTIEGEEVIAKEDSLDESVASTTPITSTGPTETTKLESKQVVEKYVAKMYTLQTSYLSALGAIESKARAVFSQLPKEERNLSTAQKLAPSFISEGIALESKCDSEVNRLLNEFEAELKKADGDTTIVKTMREAYQTQKRLKKAYYLSAIK